ncbi:MAG: hypothetical protein JWM14_2316 [Chitinophagaceae bacterium]|nr:hypothetical protein [Chitinophagaceae bacterium]
MLFFKAPGLLKEALLEIELLKKNNLDLNSGIEALKNENSSLANKYAPLIEVDKFLEGKKNEIQEAELRLKELNEKYISAVKIHENLEYEISLYSDSLEIGSFGLYKAQHDFETSEQFKSKLDLNYEKQKQLIKTDQAIVCTVEWEVGGSKVEGRKMTNQYKKLMLYAFNGECDSLIAKTKWNNAAKTQERINKTFDSINALGKTQATYITNTFLNIKLEEFTLTYEYEQKKYEEKEEQKRIREQMRDEEKAQRELEKAQKEAEDEERRFEKALDKAKKELGQSSGSNTEALNEQIKLLEEQLHDAQERKERAISLAQLTKVGHIYVISNLGSFGEDVYKIGMTRRLDPLDRVKELGDASVPFQFDVHAIIYSENAPQLENEFHQKFKERRLNRINHKKEFFKVSLDEIEAIVKQHVDAEIEFTKLAEAREYRETLSFLEQLKNAVDEVKVESKFPTSLM